MNTTDIGNRGETIASVFLQQQGYTILDRNWKHARCEIDIVAKKDACVYFVEVKYRKNSHFGDGLDYITYKKQQQMYFAARMWSAAHAYEGDMQLAAIGITGSNEEVTFVPCL